MTASRAGSSRCCRPEGLADASKVFVAGADADRRNIRWVAEGVQAVDVWKEIEPLAFQAAEAAVASGAGSWASPQRSCSRTPR